MRKEEPGPLEALVGKPCFCDRGFFVAMRSNCDVETMFGVITLSKNKDGIVRRSWTFMLAKSTVLLSYDLGLSEFRAYVALNR